MSTDLPPPVTRRTTDTKPACFASRRTEHHNRCNETRAVYEGFGPKVQSDDFSERLNKQSRSDSNVGGISPFSDQAFFSNRVIQTKITAPTNATIMEPTMPPPCQIPKSPKIHPPKSRPRCRE